jgi:hypothetical protein
MFQSLTEKTQYLTLLYQIHLCYFRWFLLKSRLFQLIRWYLLIH